MSECLAYKLRGVLDLDLGSIRPSVGLRNGQFVSS
jgi:hypothetical protein